MAQGRTPTSRLPSTRESRPALIGLAILLIVGGALASGYLALQAGNRASFLMVDKGVATGSTITEDDLGRVSLPEGYSGGIPESQKAKVVGQAAKVTLLQGTVLSRAMISDEAGVDPDQSQLAFAYPSSDFISGLQPGSQVALSLDTDSSSSGSTETAQPSVLAELVSVNTSSGGGGITGGGSSSTSVIVNVDVSCLSEVSQAAKNDTISVALVGDPDNAALTKTCGG